MQVYGAAENVLRFAVCGEDKMSRILYGIYEVNNMDLRQIGRFIAQQRKELGLTQEQLGERISVTGKTVSRWETGVYLPPAEALITLSEMFGVSINEILSGRKLSSSEYKAAAEENLCRCMDDSMFTVHEKHAYYKNKWLRDHMAAMLGLAILVIEMVTAGIVMKEPLLVAGSSLLLAGAHAWRHNAMMGYTEHHIYDRQ